MTVTTLLTPAQALVGAERWRTIRDAPLYQVSDLGRVRRLIETTGDFRDLRSAPNTQRSGPGYLKVHLGSHRQAYVHHLVLTAFVGPRPRAHQADHIDFNRQNNSLTNLRWIPAAENRWRWKEAELRGIEDPMAEVADAPSGDDVDDWSDWQRAAGWS